jgi:hypothetical protein
MRFRIAGGALSVVVVCAVGCGSKPSLPPERVGSSQSAIQGGAMDTTHTFAVAICGGAEGGPDQGQNCELLCSGALIAPNLVISARHCVDNVASDTVDCSTETFGPPLAPAADYYITSDSDIFDPEAKWYQVAQIVTPTPTSFCGNDLSILILTSNVPTTEVPTLAVPEIWYPIDSSMYATRETAIGYGLDAPDDETSAGVRRILESIPIECIPNDPDMSLACPPVDTSGVAANEFEAGNGPCEGDSGSSAYEQNAFSAGTFLSLGVLSRGGASGDMCVGSVYTQLYPWQSLILSTAMEAATMGGYSPPAWTTNPSSKPPADGGTTGDGGTNPGTDGGGNLPIGATCTVSSSCESNLCVAPASDAGFTCSQKCDAGSDGGADGCPAGFSCFMDYCFTGSALGTLSSSGSSGGGCSLAPGRAAPPATGNGDAWPAALGVGLFAALTRRTRRTRRTLRKGGRRRGTQA